MTDREQHLVELVDSTGAPVGHATVDAAHRTPGHLHRAFSVMLVDDGGRLLLQQRAAAKTRFAMRWANACCGHPQPGEPVAEAAARRLTEELGVVATAPLTEVGVYVYRARDPHSARVEHEYDHVLVARAPAAVRFAVDPDEVTAVRWLDTATLNAEMALHPDRYAPWLSGVLAAWRTSPVR